MNEFNKGFNKKNKKKKPWNLLCINCLVALNYSC